VMDQMPAAAARWHACHAMPCSTCGAGCRFCAAVLWARGVAALCCLACKLTPLARPRMDGAVLAAKPIMVMPIMVMAMGQTYTGALTASQRACMGASWLMDKRKCMQCYSLQYRGIAGQCARRTALGVQHVYASGPPPMHTRGSRQHDND